MDYHVPVLLTECIEALEIKPAGVYLDFTFGGGGHSKEILKHLDDGQLFGFDQDPDAAKNAESIQDRSFTFIDSNFRFAKRHLRMQGITKVDGILADLGVSSHQFDAAERGFTYRSDSPLDMRMDQASEKDAAVVLNSYRQAELQEMFSLYGEIRNARTLASKIVERRQVQEFQTSFDLLDVLKGMSPGSKEMKYFAQVFQALRIEVNDEMNALKEVLEQSGELLKEDGRLVVMSYHSLEDRLVKNYIQKGRFKGEAEKDLYGNDQKPLDAVNRKPIIPNDEEIERNPRARSAKLRIAKRTDWQWPKTN